MRWNMRLSMRKQTILANLITAVVIASLVAAAWRLALRLVDALGEPPQLESPAIRVASAAPASATFHPFGVEDRSDTAGTSLPIELRGIIYSPSERLAVAYVARTGAPARAVRIGEDAGGGDDPRDRPQLCAGARRRSNRAAHPFQRSRPG